LYYQFLLKKLFVDPEQKIRSHVNFLFGKDVGALLPDNLEIEYSRKTGKVKSFSIDGGLIGTFRTDGGIALSILGASLFLKSKNFVQNTIVPIDDAIPFVSEGRSLFIKHILKCGKNIQCGSDVAILDRNNSVIAVGRSLFSYEYFSQIIDDVSGGEDGHSRNRGIGVKVREGIKSRTA
jgi:uncharacterized protein with predicted RNA binding PUA domain